MNRKDKGKAKRHFFLAVEIPQNIAGQIHDIQAGLPGEWPSKTKQDYHCTLAYFGGVEEDRIPELKREITKISYRGFPLHVSGFGCFNRANTSKRNHVLFAKFNDGAQSEIKSLHSKVIAGLRVKRFQVGRLEIYPPVTIRKIPLTEGDEKEMIDFIRCNETFKSTAWSARNMVLYESLPHGLREAGKPTYFEECRFSLL